MEVCVLHGSRFPRYSACTLVELVLPPSLYSQLTVTGSLLDQSCPRYVWFLLAFASMELPVTSVCKGLVPSFSQEGARMVPPAAWPRRTVEGIGQNHKTQTMVIKKAKLGSSLSEGI